MGITSKKYKNTKTGKIEMIETNHFGDLSNTLLCIEEEGLRQHNQRMIEKKDRLMRVPASKLVKRQTKSKEKLINIDREKGRIEVVIRYDDQCGNGHNTFSITGTIYTSATSSADRHHYAGGCIHEEIEKYFPSLKKYIKWHGVTSEEPLYYIENTLYHAKENGITKGWLYFKDEENGIKENCLKYDDIEALEVIKSTNPENYIIKGDENTIKEANLSGARSCAVWEDATIEQLRDKKQLLERLPKLMKEFKKDMESLGFTY